jgi:Trk K+ transport system NAD-binding subunit
VTRATALLLRRMRVPLLLIIAAYAISVLGFVLIPAVDDQGQPWRMDFLHAFYVVSYTATTIGFGELPYLFTPLQRLWMTFSVYLTVVTWFYALGNILTLLQDPAFQLAIREGRFSRAVRRVRDPFYLVCGYGDTGSLLVRSLIERGLGAVVLDIDPERISTLRVENLGAYVPGLTADAAVPAHLLDAGLRHPRCAGVLALTDRDPVNLQVAITSKLLAPKLPVICRAESREAAANMASFGTDHIVNPFEAFAERLATALHSPETHVLFDWLTGVPRSHLDPVVYPPSGTWVLCGYGRFGKALRHRLEGAAVTTVTIEATPEKVGCADCIQGTGTEAATLRAAGVDRAVGIVAGTDDDANNLSILMTAREINAALFLVARQNRRANEAVFQALRADLVMQRSQIIAHEILARITTPLLLRFLDLAQQQSREWAEGVLDELASRVGAVVPDIWTVRVTPERSPALAAALRGRRVVSLGDLARDPRDRERELPCVALMLLRGSSERLLPARSEELMLGDVLLYCGGWGTASEMGWTQANQNVLTYVLTGEQRAAGHLWSWLERQPRMRGRAREKGVGPQ